MADGVYRGPIADRNAPNTAANYQEFLTILGIADKAIKFGLGTGDVNPTAGKARDHGQVIWVPPPDPRLLKGLYPGLPAFVQMPGYVPPPTFTLARDHGGNKNVGIGRFYFYQTSPRRCQTMARGDPQCSGGEGTYWFIEPTLRSAYNAAYGWGREHGYIKSSASLWGELKQFTTNFVIPALTGYAAVTTLGPLLAPKAATAGAAVSGAATAFPGVTPAVTGGAAFPGVAPVLSASAPVVSGGTIMPSILKYADIAEKISEAAATVTGIVSAAKGAGESAPLIDNTGAGSSGVLVPMVSPPPPAPSPKINSELLLGGLGAILTLVSLLR